MHDLLILKNETKKNKKQKQKQKQKKSHGFNLASKVKQRELLCEMITFASCLSKMSYT